MERLVRGPTGQLVTEGLTVGDDAKNLSQDLTPEPGDPLDLPDGYQLQETVDLADVDYQSAHLSGFWHQRVTALVQALRDARQRADLWDCEGCGFSFPKEYENEGGGFSCPVCELALADRALAAAAEREAEWKNASDENLRLAGKLGQERDRYQDALGEIAGATIDLEGGKGFVELSDRLRAIAKSALSPTPTEPRK